MTTPQNLRYLATFFALKTGEVNDDLELVLPLATDDERAQAAAFTEAAAGLADKFRAAADRLPAGDGVPTSPPGTIEATYRELRALAIELYTLLADTTRMVDVVARRPPGVPVVCSVSDALDYLDKEVASVLDCLDGTPPAPTPSDSK